MTTCMIVTSHSPFDEVAEAIMAGLSPEEKAKMVDFDSACVQQCLDKQGVQFRGRIEVIALSRVRGIGRVGCSQLRNPPQGGVRTACAKSGME